jgi:hypothetical protein
LSTASPNSAMKPMDAETLRCSRATVPQVRDLIRWEAECCAGGCESVGVLGAFEGAPPAARRATANGGVAVVC